MMMAETANTCTTLAIDNSELRRYLSREMREFADLLKGCDLCGAAEPKTYSRICDQHYLGDCCAKRKSNWSKVGADRRGEHKLCPVAGCRCAPRTQPVVDHRFTAVMLTGRKAVDHTANEAREAEIRSDARAALHAEMAVRAPSRKRKADCTAEEWAEMQLAKRERKAERDEAKELAEHNAKFVALASDKMIELIGREAYEEWLEWAFAPRPKSGRGCMPPAPAAPPASPIDAAMGCGECEEEE